MGSAIYWEETGNKSTKYVPWRHNTTGTGSGRKKQRAKMERHPFIQQSQGGLSNKVTPKESEKRELSRSNE